MRKRHLILLSIGLLFISECTQTQTKNKDLEEFVMDLSSANVKLRGNLILFGEYKGDLSALNYEKYLELLKQNEVPSNRGVANIIKKADAHFFAVKSNTFLIAIYSKDLNVMLYDDANTAFTDSILIIQEGMIAPALSEFISKTEYNR